METICGKEGDLYMLSIVIPAYNEENRLPGTLKTIHQELKHMPYEIIVVDDGSSDRTCEVAQSTRLIKLGRNIGKGAAVTKGLSEAQGDIVVILDADMPTTIKEILRLAEMTATYDVVIGSRRMPNSEVTRNSRKKITSYAFSVITKFITKLPYNDTQCGVKVLRKSALSRILPLLSEKQYLFDIDLLYAARTTKCTVKEEGITWVDQKGSKVNVWKDSCRMAVGLVPLKKKYKQLTAKPYEYAYSSTILSAEEVLI